jgi:hypothetical protein
VTASAALTAEQEARLLEICEKTPVTLAVKPGIDIETRLASSQAPSERPT